jgi:hypothetical protein
VAKLKPIEDVVCCCVDYGAFICLSDKLSESFKKVYYYSPIDDEYRNVKDCVIGDGLAREGHRIERINEFMSPEIIDEVDLFIFPDIGWAGTQRYLRDVCEKAVWGSMGYDQYELYRTRFLALLEQLGLPVIPWKKIVGLSKLADHLKTVKNKWVKINRFRENMETWHHLDWNHSQRKMEELAIEFGGVKEKVIFVVQDHIETDGEIGYDGWNVFGQYPTESFMGYEKKNELYLGCKVAYKDLPESVRVVNEAIAASLEEFGYANFIATEIREKDGKPYFIDPTPRLPGQTGEQLLETCTNLAEVIWKGANGELIKPEFKYDFAVEATIHYTDNPDIWKTIYVPKEVERWTKLYHYCIVDGVYQFPPGKNDELGVLLGVGKTIEAAVNHLKKNLEILKDEPICVRMGEMGELLNEAKQAQKTGIPLPVGKIPDPGIILKGRNNA